MDDKKLSEALYEALVDEYLGEIPEITKPHKFSKKFEKKMNKLISRRNKPYYKIINTAGKRAALIAVITAAVTSAVFSIEAVRVAFIDFFTNIFEKYSIIEPVNIDEAPLIIEDVYTITYDLSGYSIIDELKNELLYCIIYSNESTSINFRQHIKYDFLNSEWNTEETIINEIYINGKQAIYYTDNNGFKTIIWDNGDYIFVISANIDDSMLIEIAQSVKKAD